MVMYRHLSYLISCIKYICKEGILHKTKKTSAQLYTRSEILFTQRLISTLKENNLQFEDGWATLRQGLPVLNVGAVLLQCIPHCCFTLVTGLLHQHEAHLKPASL